MLVMDASRERRDTVAFCRWRVDDEPTDEMLLRSVQDAIEKQKLFRLVDLVQNRTGYEIILNIKCKTYKHNRWDDKRKMYFTARDEMTKWQ